MTPRNLIANMIDEAEAYNSLDNIEKLVDKGQSLTNLPMQPLYVAMRELSPEVASAYLVALSPEQRKTFLNLDLWKKDVVHPDSFLFWVKSFHACPVDKLRYEFVRSTEFMMFLKARFNIWSFDVEDPSYPDHDNYFLTDDSLLLFEFNKEFEYADEVQNLVRELYADMGVDKAYSYLFKMISENYSTMLEEEYRMKNEWLRDYGFVDYFEALEIDNPFPNRQMLDHFINTKKVATGEIDVEGQNQILHKSAMVAFKAGLDDLSSELEKVQSEKRQKYLQFNFIRVMNGNITLRDALRDGGMALSRLGRNAKALINLGYSYVLKKSEGKLAEFGDEYSSYFDIFDFTDFYKIGNSLVKDLKKQVKKSLTQNGFEDEAEKFLGSFWVNYLDLSFDEPPQLESVEGKVVVDNFESFEQIDKLSQTLIELVPFAKKFFDMFSQMKTENKVHDSFYLNYSVEDIDLEALLLSFLANSSQGLIGEGKSPKLGVTIEEYKKFCEIVVDKTGKLLPVDQFEKILSSFETQFGLNEISGIKEYLYLLLKNQVEGYEFSNLSEEEFKHVGGPIIFTSEKAQ